MKQERVDPVVSVVRQDPLTRVQGGYFRDDRWRRTLVHFGPFRIVSIRSGYNDRLQALTFVLALEDGCVDGGEEALDNVLLVEEEDLPLRGVNIHIYPIALQPQFQVNEGMGRGTGG